MAIWSKAPRGPRWDMAHRHMKKTRLPDLVNLPKKTRNRCEPTLGTNLRTACSPLCPEPKNLGSVSGSSARSDRFSGASFYAPSPPGRLGSTPASGKG